MKRLATRSRVSQIVAGASVVAFAISAQRVYTQTTDRASVQHRSQQDRFQPIGAIDPELAPTRLTAAAAAVTEAPSGFDNLTNGFDPQGPPFDDLDEDTVMPGRSFNDNRFIFEEVEGADEGLGPTFNAQSCRECHQNVVTGGASQITEQRTGRLVGGIFFESLGGSLIHSRATHPGIVEHVADADGVRTFRMSTNTLGNGFVECISNTTLLQIRDGQPGSLRGTAVGVSVLEADNATRVGRFGWKGQHASLLSFSADAYLNEMGITSEMFPNENSSSGRSVVDFDPMDDPEDDGDDVEAFANFMRSTKAPPRGPITGHKVAAGRALFDQIGCVKCHVASIVTAAPGTVINGGEFVVPPALGNKVIHPFSDFLLHNIGTGDGIPILPTPEFAGTANQIRTAPLWGLRTRNRLMHDGLSFTCLDAIRRHAGQATSVTNKFKTLSMSEQKAVVAFLDSL